MEPLPSPPAKPPISTSPASNNPNPQTITNTTPINPTPKDIYRGINWILDDADDDDVDDVSTDSKPAVTSTPVFDKKVFQNALKTIVKTDKKLGKYHFNIYNCTRNASYRASYEFESAAFIFILQFIGLKS